MKIIGANVTGSFILNGVDVTNTLQSSSIWSGSVASSINSLNSATASLNAATASLYNYTSSNTTNINTLFTASASLDASVTSLNAATASLNTATASFSSSIGSLNNATASLNTATSSLNSSITSLNAATASFSSAIGSLNNATASLYTATSSLNSSITSLNAATASLLSFTASQAALNVKYATTGSNTFTGTQTITGSLFISQNLVVQGSSSIQNITASVVSIGTNTVILNTDTPSIRFGGIKVQDSGSGAGASGSLLWDSQEDRWIYVTPSGSAEGYNSAILIGGPKNLGSIGSELGLTTGKIQKAVGGDHIGDSIMTESGTTVSVSGSLSATSLTGSINGSQITDATVSNAKLANSTISGISLGSNLATLTIGTGLSGTSYNGSTGITIANTITNNNQLTNGAGYITSTGTAAAINQTITAGSEGNLVFATIGTNDFFRIRAGGGSNAGFVEIATADDGTEPIYVRQYTGEFASLTRTATLLDGSGNTSFPGSLSATNLSGTNTGDQTNISGNAATATTATSATTATNVASPDGDRNPSTKLPTTNARNVRFDFSGAGAVGGTGNYAGVMTYAPWDGTTASTGDSSYQLAFLNETGVNASGVPGLSIRNGIDSTWKSWYRIITSGNYGSYAVPLTGGTMTGNLNITGGLGEGNTSPYSSAKRLIFNNDYTTTAKGPNKITLYDASFLAGFGIHTSTLSYYSGDTHKWYKATNADNASIMMQVDGSGNFVATGDVTAYSDIRVKENILNIVDPLNTVLRLRGVSYNRIDTDDKTTKIGFIAQEIEKIVPEVVSYDELEDRYSVSYGNVTALLVEAIKEQQTQIEDLKTIINGLTK
jgi:exonuclease VII small subunit